MPQAVSELTPKAQRTRASLLAAARGLIGTQGLAALSVMAVCQAAGVGRTSFYSYFKDLEALEATVAEEAAGQIKASFDRAHNGVPRGEARLEACLRMILRLSAEDPELMLLVTAMSAHRPQVAALLEREICAELAEVARLGAEERTALTQFLSAATLALARRFASGAMLPEDVTRQVKFLMRALGR